MTDAHATPGGDGRHSAPLPPAGCAPSPTAAPSATSTTSPLAVSASAVTVQSATSPPMSAVAAVRAGLRADCGRCAGLCCVAPGFAASADFPISKPPGVPCRNLTAAFTCGVHGELRERGFHGCVAFDCLGAGQRITEHTFAGVDWRTRPDTATRMFDAFAVMRALHETLHHLAEALTRLAEPDTAERRTVPATGTARGAGPVLAEVRAVWALTLTLTDADADTLLAADLPALHRDANGALTAASALLRAGTRPPALAGDLVGARLAGADLRGADLTGRLLLGADLRGADLRRADLRGADLRGADLRGATLTDALFLTPSQLHAARGDAATAAPAAVPLPTHWLATPAAANPATGRRTRPAKPRPGAADGGGRTVARERGRGGRSRGR
ncbi:pentapeptide repeat-containing protein [Frankia canadensis]|nr:pentapeptide repeat-containing protein [Frankia canadensis]